MSITPYLLWKIALALVIGLMFLWGKQLLLFIPLILIFVTLFIYGVWNMRLQFFGKVLFRAPKQSNAIALTFDDGPDPDITPEILELLDTYGIKATFFVVGKKVQQHPELLKQCFDKGHVIACHDYSHSNLSNLRTTKPLIRDIEKARECIYQIIGKKPLLYRPPVGLMNPHVPKALAHLNMTCIGWNKSCSDAGNRRLKRIRCISTLASPGAIVLLHDCLPKKEYKEELLNQLGLHFQEIKKKDLCCVTIDSLFNIPAYE